MNNIDAAVNRCIDFEEARKAAYLTRGIIMVDVQSPKALNSKFPESRIKGKAIAFIDRGIDDYQTLVSGIDAGITVHVIDSKQDGVMQITDILQRHADVDAIHIISHGNIGCLTLGNSVLSTGTLSKYRHALLSWQAGLRKNAEILIYGCDVAKGATGRAFIENLADITGANIAASNNLTGNGAYGGDWKLSVATGNIAAEPAFCEEKLRHFATILATNTLEFTNDTVTDFVTATHPTADFGTISFKIVSDENSTGIANGSLTLASTGSVDDTFDDFFYDIGSDGEYIVIYTDGREVDFQSIGFGSGNGSTYTSLTVHAYKDGTLLGNQTFSPAGVNFPNNTSDTETVTFTDNIFENADEIRFIGVDGVNEDVVNALIDDVVIADAVPTNTTPAISINNANLAYTENMVATQIDAVATLTDADGDADWNGGTLVVQITANNEASDQLSIVDNAVGTINTSGTNLLDGATVIGTLSAAEGTVTNGTALTITFNGNATNALVQQVARAIHYSSTSDDPGTSNRTITFTATDTNAAGANDTRTVTVTAVNDEPTLTATGANPTFTEGGAAVSLFSGAAASTIESGQTFSALTLTVTNVNDGSNERLNADGTTIVLTHGTSNTTASNSLSYSVSVIGTTATVSLTGGTLSTAAAQTLIDGISYQNNSNDPNTSNRVVTLTSIQDSGGTANGGDNTASLAIASAVTVNGVNDEPTLTATGANPTFAEGGAAVSLFSGAAASTVESGQTLSALTLTVTNVNDGSNERLNADGTTIALTHGTSGTTASNSLSYSVSVVGTTATVSFTGGTLSTAAAQTLIDGISYQNNSNDPNTSNRVVTLTSLQDSGGTANGGDDTAALGISSTVTVTANPAITSASYDYSTNQLVVTGTDFVTQGGAVNDVDVSLLTVTGEGGATYTLTSAIDVEIDSATQFTVTLSGADLINVETLLNKNGTESEDATTFNLAAADNWMTGTSAAPDISDASNAITVSNYSVPTITSATYNASTGQLVISGGNFVSQAGAANDLDTSLLTVTGDGGSYTLTDTPDVDVTSDTSASLTLSAADQLNIHGLLNKDGTTSGGAVTYNLAAADNWLFGAPATNDIGDTTGNAITVSNVQIPTITSAAYDASTHELVVTGANLFKKAGANNDIDVSLFTMVGGDNENYTLATTTDVEITSASSFTIHVTGADQSALDDIFDQLGTTSSFATTYDIQTADNWLTAADPATNIADNNAEGGVNVMIPPAITSSAYDAATGVLVVTGSNIQANGGGSDIDVSRLTFTGEGGTAYTLTDSADVERDSIVQFTVTLSATDKAAINQIINKDGTTSTGGTSYNLAAADDWNTNITADDTSDASNSITVSNVPVPTVTSATYNASTGVIAVTGTNFMRASGATNDIIANKFTFTGEGGESYTLTDSANVDITSGTAFTLTLSAADEAAINQIINKNGTSSTGGTSYNLAAAEDWAAGADAAANVVDATGNAITVSNVAVPNITSATYHTGTGLLSVTGTGFLKKSGATNDIDASLFTFTGEAGATYTLTDTADVEITSITAFTVTLSATDKAAVNLLLNKNGAASVDATTYNLAAAEDWAVGADAAVNVADITANGITVTIPAPSSGGGGGGGGGDTPTPPQITENTIDGVNTRTTTEEDGSTTINVDVTENSREDDPATISAIHADIPVQVNTEGEPVLIVSLPTGVGLNVNGQSAALDTQDAVEDLIARIEQRTAADSSQRLDMTVHGQDFITSLAAGDTVAVQTITLTVSGEQAPNAPIIITAKDDAAGGNKQALVIDASNLPSGSVLQLDNVSFAAIVGAVQIVGGAGQNLAAGDHQNQFIVMGADDDRLFGGGGDDTVGSLGGNDLTSGDAGNDIVYGGSANDIISGGSGNDRLNGGFGFDIALQAGQQFDYQIEALGNQVILTHTSGTVDILTDTEFVHFDNGPGLAIAHSAAEAAAHHLVKTWLGRDLTADEGVAVQNWQGADAADIARAFLALPEAAEFQGKTTDELLAGLDDNPDIIRLDVNREIIAGEGDDQGYLPMGLALNADGNAGYDVLRMLNSRSDVHLETAGDRLELTRFEDGAMLSVKNAEAIAFDSGEAVILAHNAVEGTLARLVHTLLNRGATVEEWQAGNQALSDNVAAQAFFDWFQDRTDFDQLSDSEYIQVLFQNTLQRSAATDEVNGYLAKLDDGSLNRDWLAVDIAQSEEAIAVIGSVIELDGGI